MTMSGTARTSVADVMAYQEPKAPGQSAPSAATGVVAGELQPQREHREAGQRARPRRPANPQRAHRDSGAGRASARRSSRG